MEENLEYSIFIPHLVYCEWNSLGELQDNRQWSRSNWAKSDDFSDYIRNE